MSRLVLALLTFVGGCSSFAEAPTRYELSWAKHNVSLEAFSDDVDACNAAADVAGGAVSPQRGDPANDGYPLIMAWRWLSHGVATNAAMTDAYERCFTSRGYALVYVTEQSARAFDQLRFRQRRPGESLGQNLNSIRDAQLQFLHGIAAERRPPRAPLAPNRAQLPLMIHVFPPQA